MQVNLSKLSVPYISFAPCLKYAGSASITPPRLVTCIFGSFFPACWTCEKTADAHLSPLHAPQVRQREKDEDAKYREKLRLRMEEDRKERRRKLGLPEELTEEEKVRGRNLSA